MAAATPAPPPRPGGGGPSSPAPVRKLGADDFLYGALLGEGAFARVVHARLRPALVRDGRAPPEFAAKIMEKRHIRKESKTAAVMSERNVLSRAAHPNIVRLCYTFQDAEYLYLMLELVRGRELLALINACAAAVHAGGGGGGDPLERLAGYRLLPRAAGVAGAGAAAAAAPPSTPACSVELARFYAAQLVNALEYLHCELRVVHRDLKPENVLLSERGHAKLTDFGSSKSEAPGSAPETRCDAFVGTAEYVSPEVLRDERVHAPADLWALGCVLYQCLTGAPPFRGGSEYLTFQQILGYDGTLNALLAGDGPAPPPRAAPAAATASELERARAVAGALGGDAATLLLGVGALALPPVDAEGEHQRALPGTASFSWHHDDRGSSRGSSRDYDVDADARSPQVAAAVSPRAAAGAARAAAARGAAAAAASSPSGDGGSCSSPRSTLSEGAAQPRQASPRHRPPPAAAAAAQHTPGRSAAALAPEARDGRTGSAHRMRRDSRTGSMMHARESRVPVTLLRFPRHFPADARDLILQLLHHDPLRRLGVVGFDSAQEPAPGVEAALAAAGTLAAAAPPTPLSAPLPSPPPAAVAFSSSASPSANDDHQQPQLVLQQSGGSGAELAHAAAAPSSAQPSSSVSPHAAAQRPSGSWCGPVQLQYARIREHPFFSGVDWASVSDPRTPAPVTPLCEPLPEPVPPEALLQSGLLAMGGAGSGSHGATISGGGDGGAMPRAAPINQQQQQQQHSQVHTAVAAAPLDSCQLLLYEGGGHVPASTARTPRHAAATVAPAVASELLLDGNWAGAGGDGEGGSAPPSRATRRSVSLQLHIPGAASGVAIDLSAHAGGVDDSSVGAQRAQAPGTVSTSALMMSPNGSVSTSAFTHHRATAGGGGSAGADSRPASVVSGARAHFLPGPGSAVLVPGNDVSGLSAPNHHRTTPPAGAVPHTGGAKPLLSASATPSALLMAQDCSAMPPELELGPSGADTATPAGTLQAVPASFPAKGTSYSFQRGDTLPAAVIEYIGRPSGGAMHAHVSTASSISALDVRPLVAATTAIAVVSRPVSPLPEARFYDDVVADSSSHRSAAPLFAFVHDGYVSSWGSGAAAVAAVHAASTASTAGASPDTASASSSPLVPAAPPLPPPSPMLLDLRSPPWWLSLLDSRHGEVPVRAGIFHKRKALHLFTSGERELVLARGGPRGPRLLYLNPASHAVSSHIVLDDPELHVVLRSEKGAPAPPTASAASLHEPPGSASSHQAAVATSSHPAPASARRSLAPRVGSPFAHNLAKWLRPATTSPPVPSSARGFARIGGTADKQARMLAAGAASGSGSLPAEGLESGGLSLRSAFKYSRSRARGSLLLAAPEAPTASSARLHEAPRVGGLYESGAANCDDDQWRRESGVLHMDLASFTSSSARPAAAAAAAGAQQPALRRSASAPVEVASPVVGTEELPLSAAATSKSDTGSTQQQQQQQQQPAQAGLPPLRFNSRSLSFSGPLTPLKSAPPSFSREGDDDPRSGVSAGRGQPSLSDASNPRASGEHGGIPTATGGGGGSSDATRTPRRVLRRGANTPREVMCDEPAVSTGVGASAMSSRRRALSDGDETVPSIVAALYNHEAVEASASSLSAAEDGTLGGEARGAPLASHEFGSSSSSSSSSSSLRVVGHELPASSGGRTSSPQPQAPPLALVAGGGGSGGSGGDAPGAAHSTARVNQPQPQQLAPAHSHHAQALAGSVPRERGIIDIHAGPLTLPVAAATPASTAAPHRRDGGASGHEGHGHKLGGGAHGHRVFYLLDVAGDALGWASAIMAAKSEALALSDRHKAQLQRQPSRFDRSIGSGGGGGGGGDTS